MASHSGAVRAGLVILPVVVLAMVFGGCSAGAPTTPGGGSDTTHVTPIDTTSGANDTTGVTTPVGTTTGTAVTKSIGAAGGTLSSGDGRMTLTIPAGALASTVNISVQPITNQGPGGVGAGYRLLPAGQTFANPVQLTFVHTDAELEGSIPDLLGVAYQETTGYWDELPGGTYNSAAKTLTVSTTHFTDFILVVSIKLVPARASIRAGGSQGLTAVDCSYVAGTRRRLRNCVVGIITVNTWAVNGAPGGTAGLGTVSGNTLTGNYRAPVAVPSPSTVAVSANVIGGLRDGSSSTVTLVSRVTVTEDAWYGVTSTFGPLASTGTVKWTLVSTENGVATYYPSGSITSTPANCTLSPATHTLYQQVEGRLYVDYNGAVATYHGTGTSVWAATFICGPNTFPNIAVAYFGGNGGLLGSEAAGNVEAGEVMSGDMTNGATRYKWLFTRNP